MNIKKKELFEFTIEVRLVKQLNHFKEELESNLSDQEISNAEVNRQIYRLNSRLTKLINELRKQIIETSESLET